jgi:hypothetical protein
MYNVFIIRADGKVEHSTQPKAPDLAQLQHGCCCFGDVGSLRSPAGRATVIGPRPTRL